MIEVEVWRYHLMIDEGTFETKEEALAWMKKGGYDIMWDNGDCCFEIYVNGHHLSVGEEIDQGWVGK